MEAAPEPVALPAEVLTRVDELKTLQKTRLEQKEAYMTERRQLEKKYSVIYKELYAKREAIVQGTADPAAATGDAVKGIPEFWLTALQNHRRVADTIEEHDEDALKYLSDITCTDNDEMTGFTLAFKFRENPYFTNAELTKSLHVSDLLATNGMSLEKSVGTEINWKPEKDLTVKLVKKTVKKGKGRPKTVMKQEPQESFFRYFEDNAIPEEEEMKEMEQDEAMELFQIIQMEAGVSFAIRNAVIPNAVDWFTGEAEDEEDDDDDEEDDDEYEGDEEDEEDDAPELVEDEEEEAPKPRRGGGGGRGGRGNKAAARAVEDEETDALADSFDKKLGGGDKGADGEKPPECKQQ